MDEPEEATVAIADHESDEIVKTDVEIQVDLAPIVKDAQTQIAPERNHIGTTHSMQIYRAKFMFNLHAQCRNSDCKKSV